jgi:uncharacterized protein
MLTKEQNSILKAFFTKQPVLKAYLFGSVSRGEDDAESDLDILVELDHSQPIGLSFLQMQFDLCEILSKKVDLISANGLSKHMRPFIDKDKKLIYARKVG